MTGRIKDRVSDGVSLGHFFPVLSGDEFVSSQPGGFLSENLSVPSAVSPNRPMSSSQGEMSPAPFGTSSPGMSLVPIDFVARV